LKEYITTFTLVSSLYGVCGDCLGNLYFLEFNKNNEFQLLKQIVQQDINNKNDGHKESITVLACIDSQKMLVASASTDNFVKIWNCSVFPISNNISNYNPG
jgi:hypothetical protein